MITPGAHAITRRRAEGIILAFGHLRDHVFETIGERRAFERIDTAKCIAIQTAGAACALYLFCRFVRVNRHHAGHGDVCRFAERPRKRIGVLHNRIVFQLLGRFGGCDIGRMARNGRGVVLARRLAPVAEARLNPIERPTAATAVNNQPWRDESRLMLILLDHKALKENVFCSGTDPRMTNWTWGELRCLYQPITTQCLPGSAVTGPRIRIAGTIGRGDGSFFARHLRRDRPRRKNLQTSLPAATNSTHPYQNSYFPSCHTEPFRLTKTQTAARVTALRRFSQPSVEKGDACPLFPRAASFLAAISEFFLGMK